MNEIPKWAVVYLIVVLVAVYVTLKLNEKKYAPMIKPLSDKDFGLKEFFPVGFFMLERMHYSYGSALDRKLRRQLVELFDVDYAEYYLRVYWASAVTYLVIGAVLSGLFALGMGIPGLLMGVTVGLAMAYAEFNDLNSKVEKRHLAVSINMPDLTNKILILSGAGMTLRAALIKIAHEMSADTPLYQSLQSSVRMMENGATDEAALNRLVMRCNTPAMRRFVSVVLQNMRRGGADVIGALNEIGREQWNERKAAAKRVSEEADTKLLFPMMLMLASVLIMTAGPALMSVMRNM